MKNLFGLIIVFVLGINIEALAATKLFELKDQDFAELTGNSFKKYNVNGVIVGMKMAKERSANYYGDSIELDLKDKLPTNWAYTYDVYFDTLKEHRLLFRDETGNTEILNGKSGAIYYGKKIIEKSLLDQWCTVKIVKVGNTFEVFVNGDMILTKTLKNFSRLDNVEMLFRNGSVALRDIILIDYK